MGIRRIVPALAVVAAMGLLLGACGEDDAPLTTGSTGGEGSSTTTATDGTALGPIPDGAEGLEEAERRWAAAGIADYDMTYQELCFCPQAVVTVVVRGGEVVETSVEQEPETSWEPEGRTVEDLFGEIRQAVETDAHEIQATYDPATGRPTRLWIDQVAAMADEEHGVEVRSFSPGRPIGEPVEPSSSVVTTGTTQAPSTRAVATADLTEMWGCGYGFHASNPEQTVALRFTAATSAPPSSRTAELPDPAWEAEVVTGTDLYANWCDDVIEPDEPTPVIDGTFPVVGGTIAVTAPTPNVGCGDAEATAVITGLEVRAPDGATLGLGDLTVTNPSWGCFAG